MSKLMAGKTAFDALSVLSQSQLLAAPRSIQPLFRPFSRSRGGALRMPAAFTVTTPTDGPFNWINNQRVPASGGTDGQTFDDIEPRSGKVLAKVGVSGQADVDDAVAAAKAAQPAWNEVWTLDMFY